MSALLTPIVVTTRLQERSAMTTYLEPESSVRSHNVAATSPRFPAIEAGSSLSNLVHSTTEGLVVLDVRCKIVLISHTAERMFGYPAHDLLNKSVDILLPPHLGAEQRRRMARLASIPVNGRKLKVALKGLHVSGEEFAVNASASRTTMQGEPFLIVVLQEDKALTGFDTKKRPIRRADLRKLAVSSQQTNEVEKRRFSKKLYDDIGQRLSVLKLDLDWLENSLPETDACVPARVAQMQGMLDKVITMTKTMASTLRPPLLDDFGLIPAVEWMTDNFQKRTGVACQLILGGVQSKLGDPIESAVFRVIQEALLNIERHAEASQVELILLRNGSKLDLTVRDNGKGIAAGSESKPGCYGLMTMRERIFILGGTITVGNINPHGVEISVSIPIDSFPIH
jgi:PAS domain S-box-containing protein